MPFPEIPANPFMAMDIPLIEATTPTRSFAVVIRPCWRSLASISPRSLIGNINADRASPNAIRLDATLESRPGTAFMTAIEPVIAPIPIIKDAIPIPNSSQLILSNAWNALARIRTAVANDRKTRASFITCFSPTLVESATPTFSKATSMAIIAKVALANTHVSFADSVNLANAPARIEIATDIPIRAPDNVRSSALPAVIFLPLIIPRMAVSSPKSNATAARDLPMFSGFTREITNKEAAKIPIEIAIDLRTSAFTLFWNAFSVSPAVLRTLVSALATPAQLVFIAANALAIFFICS